jgi:hypothetical protein
MAVALAAAPAAALACPVCAQGGDAPYLSLLVGAMIAAPYVVVALVVRAIRSAEDGR